MKQSVDKLKFNFISITLLLLINFSLSAQNAPVASNDTFSIIGVQAVTINASLNDYDPDGDSLIFVSQGSANLGLVYDSLDGRFVYAPEVLLYPNFLGIDSFSYTVHDVATPSQSSTAWVFIHILSSFIDSVQVTDVNSCVQNNGSITVSTSVNNLEFSIDSGLTWQSSSTFTSLSTGQYWVAVREQNTLTIEYYANPIIISMVNVPVISGVSYTNPTLCINNDGTITISATGNGLEYSIDSGNTWSSSHQFFNLSCGSYPIAIRNNDGTCPQVGSVFMLTSNTAPIATYDNYTIPMNTLLSGLNVLNNDFDPDGGSIFVSTTPITTPANGILTLHSDGTFDYIPNLQFENIDSFQYQICDTGIPTMCDTVTVSLNVINTITGGNGLFTGNVTDCANPDGFIYLEITGDTTLYEFSIDNGMTWQPSLYFNDLSAGTYSLVGRTTGDAASIYYFPFTSIQIMDTVSPVITNIIVTGTVNYGTNTGMITIQATGGTLEYSIDGGIVWNTTSQFTGLTVGTYQVCVRKTDGSCQVCQPHYNLLSTPQAPNINNQMLVSQPTCSTSGSITVTASGGISSYEYSKDSGSTWQSSSMFTGLLGGTYNMCVRNSDGTFSTCHVQSIFMNSTTGPVIDTVINVNPLNCGVSDGTITITASGGQTPLEYSIDGGIAYSTSNSFSGLPCGIYDICVRNNDGTCEICSQVTLNSTIQRDTIYANVGINTSQTFCVDTSELAGTFISLTNLNCTALQYGTVTNNGNHCITYNAGNIIGNTDTLCLVTADNLGNVDTTIYMISVQYLNTAPYANLDSIYSVNGNPAIGNILANDYDQQGDSLVANIIPFSSPSNGVISITATGDVIYTPNTGFSGVDTCMYQVCDLGLPQSLCGTGNIYIYVSNGSSLTITNISQTNESCNQNDGVITITALGGTGNYEYSIDSGTTWQASNLFTGLSAGSYPICVRDNGGLQICYPQNIIINGFATPVINNITYTNPTSYSSNDGTISIIASGGQAPLEYSLDGGTTWLANGGLFTGLDASNFNTVYTPCVRNAGGSCQVCNPVVNLQPNARPVAQADHYATLKNSSIQANVLTNDYVYVGSLASLTQITTPNYGSFLLNIDGSFTYQPNAGFVGFDTVMYEICNVHIGSSSLCDTSIVSINVYDSLTNCNILPDTYTHNTVDCNDNFEVCLPISLNDYSNYNFLVDGVSYSDSVLHGCDYDTSFVYFTGLVLVDTQYNVNWQVNNVVYSGTVSSFSELADSMNSWDSFANNWVWDYNNFTITGGNAYSTSYGTLNLISISTNSPSIVSSNLILTADIQLQVPANTQEIVLIDIFQSCSDTMIVNKNCLPHIDFVLVSNENCSQTNGSIYVSVSNGSNHQYSIDSGQTWQASDTFSNLSAGIYEVLVNDGTNTVAYINNPVVISNLLSTIVVDAGPDTTVCSSSNDITLPSGYPFGGFWWGTGIVDSQGGVFSPSVAGGNSFYDVTYNYIAPNGCSSNDTMRIYMTPLVTYNGSYSNGDTIFINTVGNNIEYSIDSGLTWQSSSIFYPVAEGNYHTAVKFANSNCITYGQVTVLANQAPIAVNDTFNINNVNPLPFNLLTNDYDLEGDSIFTIVTPVSLPIQGTVIINGNGIIAYMPNATFSGSDQFDYEVCDNNTPSLCDTATVYIIGNSFLDITNVNAIDGTCGQSNGSITISVTGGTGNYEYSIDGMQTWQLTDSFSSLPPAAYSVAVRDGQDTVIHGSLVIISTSPAPTYVTATYGNDALTIQANGGFQGLEYSLDCGTTWQTSNIFYPVSAGNYCIGIRYLNGSCPITVNVSIANNPPVAVNDSVTLVQLGNQSFNVLFNDYDLENNEFYAVPQVQYYGADSMTLDSFGVMTIPTDALSLGAYMVNYQVCEIYNPTNCSQATAYFRIIAPTDTIQTTIAIGATQTFCLPTNDLPGIPTSLSVLNGMLNIVVDSIVAPCLYLYADNYGIDTTVAVLCDNLGFCDTTYLIFDVQDGVWPGDTDDDTYANNFDLLNIGLGYGTSGTSRDVITNTWNGYITPLWNTSTPVSNIDYRHSDCNGDGIINADDTVAILQNWGLSYQRGGGFSAGAPLFIQEDPNDTVPHFSFPIILGDVNNPALNVYGGAFTIIYDTNYIKANSVHLTFNTSWIGTNNVDMIAIHKNFGNDQRIDGAFTRINGTGLTGFGEIGSFDFTIKDDILRRGFNMDSIVLGFHIVNTRFITHLEQPVDIDAQSSNITITSTKKAPELGHYVDVFPNPATEYVQIQSPQLTIEQITITDMTGKVVLHNVTTPKHSITLDISHFTSGIYNLQILTPKGMATKRLTVVK